MCNSLREGRTLEQDVWGVILHIASPGHSASGFHDSMKNQVTNLLIDAILFGI